jgi:hypothetical protein
MGRDTLLPRATIANHGTAGSSRGVGTLLPLTALRPLVKGFSLCVLSVPEF